MVDFILGALLVALFVRGWMRGFVREAVGLGVLVVGTILALRLSSPVGGVVAGMAGTSPDTSRVIGGIVVFLLVSVAAAVVIRVAHWGMNVLPGVPTVNRLAGAALAVGGGALLATVILSVLAVAPVPDSFDDEIDTSFLAEELTDPDGLPQKTLGLASGDNVLASVLRLDDIVGAPRISDPGEDLVALPIPVDAKVVERRKKADAVFDLVNQQRVADGVEPLLRTDGRDDVAQAHTLAMYQGRWMAHAAPGGTDPAGRLEAAGIHNVTNDELIGLGSSPASVVAAWADDERTAAILSNPAFSRIGIGVVDGPLGLMVTCVFTG